MEEQIDLYRQIDSLLDKTTFEPEQDFYGK